MPASVREMTIKRNGRKIKIFRVVEPNGRVVKNRSGTAVDGGGHHSRADAVEQVQAINLSEQRRG